MGNLWVERIVPNSITRHPYLYGYQMTAQNNIVEYMQGQQMLHSADAGVWQVCHGVYRIKENVEKLRIFMQQGSQVGDNPDGTKALFDDLIVLIFDSSEEAENYILNTYNPSN